jgi:hypothetical protein
MRALRMVRRSSSVVPPQTPVATPWSSAHVRQRAWTGQARQIRLAWSIWCSAPPGPASGQRWSYGVFSPASIAAGSRFSGGGNGQVARSV